MKLEKATKEIKTEREKFEAVVVKVEKVAEGTVADKFSSTLEEAEKKANEANGVVGSLKGKVKDENTLKALEGATSELLSACEKWKGKDIPTGSEGVQAYLELKRLTLTLDNATTTANESHTQWQAEQKPQGAYPGAGGPRPANAQPWPDEFGGVEIVDAHGDQALLCRSNACTNSYAFRSEVYPVRPGNGDPPYAASTIYIENGVIDYYNPGGEIAFPHYTMPIGDVWYQKNYVLGRTAGGVTAWDTNSGHGFFISNDGKRTETF